MYFPQHLSIRFDVETRHVFVGDHSGQVTILKLEQESCSLVTTFKGHTGKASGVNPVVFIISAQHYGDLTLL